MTQGESARLVQDHSHGLQCCDLPLSLTAKIFAPTFGRNPTRAWTHEISRGLILHRHMLLLSRLPARSQALPYCVGALDIFVIRLNCDPFLL